jgi:hypothetical protein
VSYTRVMYFKITFLFYGYILEILKSAILLDFHEIFNIKH